MTLFRCLVRARRLALGSTLVATSAMLRADYADLVSYFLSIQDSAIFPVSGFDADLIESAFGPRYQSSTDLYDFHRGIDLDSAGAASGVRSIVAPIAGTFYDLRWTSSGGNIVILEHSLPATYTYAGQNVTKFYTWYLHLDDSGIAANVNSWQKGDAVAQGTHLGYMGSTGAAAAEGDAYAVHLHWELRVGTNSSVEYQLANPSSTQWGFDPHWNPLLLLPTGSYTQTLEGVGSLHFGTDYAVNYTINNDETPVLNRFEVEVVNRQTDAVEAFHILDYNQRIGFDPTSTATLDTQETDVPYIEPQAYGDTAIAFATQLVVPGDWTLGLDPTLYRLDIRAYDLAGNPVNLSVNAVPEPATLAGWLGLGGLALAVRRRGRKNGQGATISP